MEEQANKTGSMIRKAFTMKLFKGCDRVYEERHNPIWRELEETLKKHGVHNYSIFINDQNGDLFGYVEIEDEALWAQIAQTKVCREWWKYMADVMETNDDNSPRTTDLREVFHLE